MSIFWQNSTNLAKKCSTTPVGPVHSSPATPLDASKDQATYRYLYVRLHMSELNIVFTYVCTYQLRHGS